MQTWSGLHDNPGKECGGRLRRSRDAASVLCRLLQVYFVIMIKIVTIMVMVMMMITKIILTMITGTWQYQWWLKSVHPRTRSAARWGKIPTTTKTTSLYFSKLKQSFILETQRWSLRQRWRSSARRWIRSNFHFFKTILPRSCFLLFIVNGN